MANMIKAGTYKVEITFTLKEDVSETELDTLFENAIYDYFSNISESNIGEYKEVEEE